jgi:6-pyruvoyl-tetrahydropterin synthase
MSVVEDIRKVTQDFLAPELRAIAVRIEELEKRMDIRFKSVDDRFNAVDQKMDARFTVQDQKMDTAEQRATERHAQLIREIARLADVIELKERVARIESMSKAS